MMSKDLQMIYRMALKENMSLLDIARGWYEMRQHVVGMHPEAEKDLPVPDYVRLIIKYRVE